MRSKLTFSLFSSLLLIPFVGCSNPQPGPDKTAAGAVLGAAWGAGAGAVVGNQVSYAGEGVAVGAGFGAVGGAMVGAGYDLNESAIIDQEEALASLKIQNEGNAQQLQQLQAKLDRAVTSDLSSGVYQVYFDVDQTNLRSGAIANLEIIGEQFKTSPHSAVINVVGHSDDSGNPEHNARLAEARARTVSGYLMARGISMNRIKVVSQGSKMPVASNSSQTGRQLNRRVDVYVTR